MSVPSDGWVGGTPTPRNDRVASVRIAIARLMVAMTSTGPITFGRTWWNMIEIGRRPMTRAACTYSLFFSTIVEPRTVRANCTQFDSPIAKMSTRSATSSCTARGRSVFAKPNSSSATSTAGKLSCTSATRMMKWSSRPPT